LRDRPLFKEESCQAPHGLPQSTDAPGAGQNGSPQEEPPMVTAR